MHQDESITNVGITASICNVRISYNRFLGGKILLKDTHTVGLCSHTHALLQADTQK